jgi:hypothetical protein
VEQKTAYKALVILLCLGIFFSPFQPVILAQALDSPQTTQSIVNDMAGTTGDDTAETASLNVLSNPSTLQTETAVFWHRHL